MNETDQIKIAHLQMVQNVISRMARNSFSLRALAVTLTSVLIAFLSLIDKPTPLYSLSAQLPLFVFWFMDARYLQMERSYRRLYEDIRLGTASEHFTMTIDQYRKGEKRILSIALSWSVLWIYAPLLIILGLISISIKF